MLKGSIDSLKKSVEDREARVLLPLLYILVLILGFNIALFAGSSDLLTTCSGFLGEEVCTPTGIFIALVASIPGYIIAGNIFPDQLGLPWILSLIIIVVVSGLFYYLLGFGVDRLRKEKPTTEVVSKATIIGVFTVLIILLLSLI